MSQRKIGEPIKKRKKKRKGKYLEEEKPTVFLELEVTFLEMGTTDYWFTESSVSEACTRMDLF